MMSNHLHAPEITEEVIQKAFEGTNFGRTDYRQFLGYSVLKKACHWHCGHTITSIMVELKLIGPKTNRLTKLGRMFLSDCYDDPRRVPPAPSDQEDWIKCSERIPKQKQSNRYVALNLLLNERTVAQGGFDDGEFWIEGVVVNNVTRWMPLPAAPE
jgi:hypothetical protein